MFSAILTAAILAIATPILTALIAVSVNKINQRQANKDLLAAPFVHVHAHYEKIMIEGSDSPLVGKCSVVKLEPGRVEIQVDGSPERISFTSVEFKKLHPFYLGYKLEE